jgi:hypothetical protein
MVKRQKERKRGVGWWVLILAVALLAVLSGYFLAMENGRKGNETAAKPEKALPSREEIPAAKLEPETSVTGAPVVSQEIVRKKSETREEYCKRIDKDVRDFFDYLNTRDYVRRIEEGTDTFDHFHKIVSRLASKLPVPAGESADSTLLNSNIYHLFRVLEKKDIRLIREVLANETETIEMVIELFYQWSTLGNRCPDPEGLRPSQEMVYHYAGFFLNTIGGRSYLFRRPLGLRLLGTYYSLLIVYAADKEGRNLYGIDPYPYIAPVEKEIALYNGFRFQQTYLEKLQELEKYYRQKR